MSHRTPPSPGRSRTRPKALLITIAVLIAGLGAGACAGSTGSDGEAGPSSTSPGGADSAEKAGKAAPSPCTVIPAAEVEKFVPGAIPVSPPADPAGLDGSTQRMCTWRAETRQGGKPGARSLTVTLKTVPDLRKALDRLPVSEKPRPEPSLGDGAFSEPDQIYQPGSMVVASGRENLMAIVQVHDRLWNHLQDLEPVKEKQQRAEALMFAKRVHQRLPRQPVTPYAAPRMNTSAKSPKLPGDVCTLLSTSTVRRLAPGTTAERSDGECRWSTDQTGDGVRRTIRIGVHPLTRPSEQLKPWFALPTRHLTSITHAGSLPKLDRSLVVAGLSDTLSGKGHVVYRREQLAVEIEYDGYTPSEGEGRTEPMPTAQAYKDVQEIAREVIPKLE